MQKARQRSLIALHISMHSLKAIRVARLPSHLRQAIPGNFLVTSFRLLIAITCYLLTLNDAVASECVDATRGLNSMHETRLTLLNDDGKPLDLLVKVADDAYERAAGFQHICPSVIKETLILFKYPVSIEGQFHMQNVHAPLDIVFFDSAGNFLKYIEMETYTETYRPLYGPAKAFQYALEAPLGFFARNKVTGYPSKLAGVR